MKFLRSFLALGGAVAAISVLQRLRRHRRELDLGVEEDDGDLYDVATRSGIADVDPEPISQVSGEGIDLERDVAASEELRALRDRLPKRS